MRLSITEMLTNLIYLKIGCCDLHTGTTSDGINFRLFQSKKKGRVIHIALSHSDNYSKRTFADSFPTWSFHPISKKWVIMCRFAKFNDAADLAEIIYYGRMGRNFYYDIDGTYFFHNTDGEIFSLPCTAVLEIQREIEDMQGPQ